MGPGEGAAADRIKRDVHQYGEERDPCDVGNDHVHREIAADEEDAVAEADMGRVLMSIFKDTTGGTHDTFSGTSNAYTNAAKYGDGRNSGQFPNGRDRFLLGAAKHGLQRRDIHAAITLFKGAKIADDGTIEPQIGPFEPGREVILRAEMEVIVVIANVPHVLDPRPDYTVTPLRLTAWRGPVAAEDDPIRTATPEGLRAFLNVEDYYRR
jgi:uncharacterized protein